MPLLAAAFSFDFASARRDAGGSFSDVFLEEVAVAAADARRFAELAEDPPEDDPDADPPEHGLRPGLGRGGSTHFFDVEIMGTVSGGAC